MSLSWTRQACEVFFKLDEHMRPSLDITLVCHRCKERVNTRRTEKCDWCTHFFCKECTDTMPPDESNICLDCKKTNEELSKLYPCLQSMS